MTWMTWWKSSTGGLAAPVGTIPHYVAPVDVPKFPPELEHYARTTPLRPTHPGVKTFLLLHGAWQSGWAWEYVAPILRKRGHTVHTPSIYGHGYPEPPDGVTIEQEALSIVEYMRNNQLYDLTLVGHSIGGIVCQRVAELCTELITQLIFFDAFLLHGDSVIDIAAAGASSTLWSAYQSDMVGGNVLLPYELFASHYIQDAEGGLARGVYSHLTPEPWGPLNERQMFAKFWDLTTTPANPYALYLYHLKTAYIVSPQDISLGHADIWEQQRDRLGPTCRHVTLAKGCHEAMFTAPSQLAEAILIAADAPVRP